MHIFLRRTSLYRVAWGIAKKGKRFVNVEAGSDADKRFSKKIERWVKLNFRELNGAHDKAVEGLPFTKVKWSQ